MLERASGCLESGARLSLRCARRSSRSKRQLHSTFWNHGVGDLGLPPSPAHTSPPSRYGEKTGSTRTDENGVVSSGTIPSSENHFLDFLYPPQALAWLHRTRDEHWEQWEKRNRRRLPAGFVQASRRHAMKSTGSGLQHRQDGGALRRRSAALGSFWSRQQRYSTQGKDSETVKEIGDEQDLAFDGLEDQDSTSPHNLRHRDDQDDDESEFASSPSDLAEQQTDRSEFYLSDSEVSVKALRKLMDGTRGKAALSDPQKSLHYTQQGWAMYERLEPTTKSDATVKTDLLEWLASHHNTEAETHCLALYHSIDIIQRNLPLYKAALMVFLRCQLQGLAEQVHTEALASLPNGHELSIAYFKYAIDFEKWDLAYRVMQQINLLHDGMGQAVLQTRLWKEVVQGTPDLLSKAISLAKHVRAASRANQASQDFMAFCARLYKEAMVQKFLNRQLSTPEENLQRGLIRYLFRIVRIHDPDAYQIFQDIMTSLIKADPGYDYPRVHHIVSYLYFELLAMKPDVAIPKEVLGLWLEKLLDYEGDLQRLRQTSRSANPEHLGDTWEKLRTNFDLKHVNRLMAYYASTGDVARVENIWQFLRHDYPAYSDHASSMWMLIYVHARRIEPKLAEAAFGRVQAYAAENGDKADLRSWNVLLYSFARADDLPNALRVFQELVEEARKQQSLLPNEFSYSPLANIWARRGDIEGVRALLLQFEETTGMKRNTTMIRALVDAHVNAGDITGAESVVHSTASELASGQVTGSITSCYNTLLTARAFRRELNATMQTYRLMKAQNVPMDGNTYAALMQALVLQRQTNAARRILNTVMKDNGVQPTAFHYAIVMTGYINQTQPHQALLVHRNMRVRNIRSTLSTKVALLKANAMLERGPHIGTATESDAPLSVTIKALKDLLNQDYGRLRTSKQPQALPVSYGIGSAIESAFGYLINIHGRRGCFEAVKSILKSYEAETKGSADKEEPMAFALLNAVMGAHLYAKDFEQVEACWHMAQAQAGIITKRIAVPSFQVTQDERDAVRILNGERSSSTSLVRPRNARSASRVKYAPGQRTPSAVTKVKPAGVEQFPALRHILSTATCYHISALAYQARTVEMISSVSKVLSQGYTLDNRTWNVLVQNLCRAAPPLALLAFTLVERFLIPLFPGWSRSTSFRPKPGDRIQGMQHIRARYLRPGQLMPTYQTLVHLGHALLQIRGLDASGSRRRNGSELDKYVGSVHQVRQHAPKTLYAVQSMPTVDDDLQRQLLRRE